MPTTKSAKKRLKQSLARKARNRSTRSNLRTLVRRVRESVEGQDAAKGDADLRIAAQRLDQAVSKGVIHINAAARLKSRLSKAVRTVKQTKSTASA